MKKITFVFILLSLSLSAFSKSFEGIVQVVNNQRYLQMANQNIAFSIQSENSSITQTILSLEDSDYISGQGKVNLIEEVIAISAVKHIGLSRLIGYWTSFEGETFHFYDYKHVIYTPSFGNEYNLHNTRATLQYLITQAVGTNHWNVLFKNNELSGFGELRAYGDYIDLTILNNKGSINRVIRLYPETLMPAFSM